MSRRRRIRRVSTRPLQYRRNGPYSRGFMNAVGSYLGEYDELSQRPQLKRAQIQRVADYLNRMIGGGITSATTLNSLSDKINNAYPDNDDFDVFERELVQILEQPLSGREKMLRADSDSEAGLSSEDMESAVARMEADSSQSSEDSEVEIDAEFADALSEMEDFDFDVSSTSSPNELSSSVSEQTIVPQPTGLFGGRQRKGEKAKKDSKRASSSQTESLEFGLPAKEIKLSPYDELRLRRFKGRSKKVQTELAPFFMFLQLHERSYPLPTVKGWVDALQREQETTIKGLPFSLDPLSVSFRENAFVLYRVSNGTTQLFLPSMNPVKVTGRRHIPKGGKPESQWPNYYTPSLELISRPDLSQEQRLSLLPKEVYAGTDVALTVKDSHRIGAPDPMNPQSNLSWYQMLFGYLGTNNMNTVFRKRGKTDKFQAFGICLFIDRSESDSDMKIDFVEYIPSPKPSFRNFLADAPVRGMIRPNPRKRKNTRRKGAKKRKVLIVRKRR